MESMLLLCLNISNRVHMWFFWFFRSLPKFSFMTLTLTFCPLGHLSLPDLNNYWLSTLLSTLGFIFVHQIVPDCWLMFLHYSNFHFSVLILYLKYENDIHSFISEERPSKILCVRGSCPTTSRNHPWYSIDSQTYMWHQAPWENIIQSFF